MKYCNQQSFQYNNNYNNKKSINLTVNRGYEKIYFEQNDIE